MDSISNHVVVTATKGGKDKPQYARTGITTFWGCSEQAGDETT